MTVPTGTTVPTGDIYYTVRLYFRREILPLLPHDDKVWREEFHRWLESQGARIRHPIHSRDLLFDALGVAPGYDLFEFSDERQASIFILKWS